MDPRILDKYELLDEIGRGGMAVVYKGYQPSLDRVVAVKVLSEELSDRLEFVERFYRESTAVARLNHPNIVHIIDRGEDDRHFYFVMEYVEGTTLKELLKKGPLPFDQIMDVAREVCSALGYAHSQGVIHRDIKPGNILIDRHGHVRIADFGIAQLTSASSEARTLTREQASMGTADYMAPEQRLDARSVDSRADLYSFGVVLYEMCTGKVPVGAFALPSQINAAIPREMDEVVLGCLKEGPGDRYARAEDILERLNRMHLKASNAWAARLLHSPAVWVSVCMAIVAVCATIVLMSFRGGMGSFHRAPQPDRAPTPIPVILPTMERTVPVLSTGTTIPSATPTSNPDGGKKTPSFKKVKVPRVESTPTPTASPTPLLQPTSVAAQPKLSRPPQGAEARQELEDAYRLMDKDRDLGENKLRELAQKSEGDVRCEAVFALAEARWTDSNAKLVGKKAREEALKSYQTVVDQCADSRWALKAQLGLARIMGEDKGGRAQALTVLGSLVERGEDPKVTCEALLCRAKILEADSKHNLAIADYEQLAEDFAEEDRNTLFSWMEIGRLHQQLRESSKAIEAYQKAVDRYAGTPQSEKAAKELEALSKNRQEK